MANSVVEVMVEGVSKKDPHKLSGRTRQNDIVVFTGLQELIGTLRRVQIVDSTPLTLFAEIIP